MAPPVATISTTATPSHGKTPAHPTTWIYKWQHTEEFKLAGTLYYGFLL